MYKRVKREAEDTEGVCEGKVGEGVKEKVNVVEVNQQKKQK